MPRNCTICDSPLRREVDRRLRTKATHEAIVLWLASQGLEIHRTAVGRHARHALPTVERRPGRQPSSDDFLTMLRDRVQADVEEGALNPSVTHGLQAQAQLDHRAERVADKELMRMIAMALTGQIPIEARVIDPEVAALEAEYRLLLPGGVNEPIEGI